MISVEGQEMKGPLVKILVNTKGNLDKMQTSKY